MWKTLNIFLFAGFLAASGPYTGFAAQLTGQVVQVHNGDVIEVLVDQNPMRIHLYGIHCPENDQTFGSEARQYTKLLTTGKIVTVQVMNRDRRGAITGKVMLPGEKNLNCELLKAGLAWWDRQSAPDDRVLKILESSAREGRIGMWSDPDSAPPGEIRKDTVSPPMAEKGSLATSRPVNDETTVFVTSTGEKYHKSGCRHLMKSMLPMRLGEAQLRGLLPCPTCDPPK